MNAVLTRNQWYHCIVELSKDDTLPEALDTIRGELNDSTHDQMDANVSIVMSKEELATVARCVGGRVGELLNGQFGDHQRTEGV
jgi:hypothetical protein